MTYFSMAERLGYKEHDAVARSHKRFVRHLRLGDCITPEEFIRSEIPALGTIRLSSIVDQLQAPLPNAADRLRRFASSLHFPVTDTIAGYTLQEKDAEKLLGWCREYTAIKPVWEAYRKKHNLPISPAEYRSFLQLIGRKHYVICKYHPCSYLEE